MGRAEERSRKPSPLSSTPSGHFLSNTTSTPNHIYQRLQEGRGSSQQQEGFLSKKGSEGAVGGEDEAWQIWGQFESSHLFITLALLKRL